MGRLKALVAAPLLLFAIVAHAQGGGAAAGSADRPVGRQIDRWSPHIEEASERFGIPADWIRRVMRAESGGRTRMDGRPITSSAGAMGLMQLMPGTWAEMRAMHRLGPDPHQPRDNILAGAAYLRAMYDRFGHPGLFAAYNAGPARYAEHLAGTRRLPAETRAYVVAVGLSPPRAAARPETGIFASLLNAGRGDVETRPRPAPREAIFVRLSTEPATR